MSPVIHGTPYYTEIVLNRRWGDELLELWDRIEDIYRKGQTTENRNRYTERFR